MRPVRGKLKTEGHSRLRKSIYAVNKLYILKEFYVYVRMYGIFAYTFFARHKEMSHLGLASVCMNGMKQQGGEGGGGFFLLWGGWFFFFFKVFDS